MVQYLDRRNRCVFCFWRNSYIVGADVMSSGRLNALMLLVWRGLQIPCQWNKTWCWGFPCSVSLAL